MAEHNHDQFAHDNTFSGPGDIDRVTGDNTSARSREANAEAADVLRAPDNERAFPVAGSGGSINERTANHEYGAS
jgi:hypothetical protein